MMQVGEFRGNAGLAILRADAAEPRVERPLVSYYYPSHMIQSPAHHFAKL
jgi:hypothetical protein